MDALERWAAIMALPEYDHETHAMSALLFKREDVTVAEIQGILAAAKKCAPAHKVETPENYDAHRARMSDGTDGDVLFGAKISDGRSAGDFSTAAQWAKVIAKMNKERGGR